MPAPVRLDAAFAVDGKPTPQFPRNRVQADVYRHILAWMPRARITDAAGRRWLVRTADEFRTMGKGLPWAAWTIRKAIRGLAADGWIETQHGGHPFGRHEQPNCTWITLPAGAEHEGNPNVALDCNQSQGEQHLEQRLPPSESNISLLHPRILTGLQGQAAPADPSRGLETEEAGQAEIQNQEGAEMAKALELFAAQKSKPKPKANLSKPLNATGLHTEFYSAYTDVWTDEMAPVSNSTRLGQLNHLLKYLRETAKLTDTEIVEATRNMVLRWDAFLAYMQKHGGPKIVQTSRPSISALVSYRDKVVNFWRTPEAEANAPPEPQYFIKPAKVFK